MLQAAKSNGNYDTLLAFFFNQSNRSLEEKMYSPPTSHITSTTH